MELDLYALSDLAEFRNGKSIKKDQYRSDGLHPVFGSNGQISRSNEVLCENPAVAIGRVGAYAGCVHRITEPAWITDNAIIAQPHDGVSNDFLYYMLAWVKPEQVVIGSAQPLITQGGLRSIEVSLPPREDWAEIGGLFSAFDDKIEVNRQIARTLEDMARALFQSWFVRFDPVRAKAEGRQPEGMDAATADLFPSEFVPSELGEIPAGWRVGWLHEIAEHVREGVKPDAVDPDTPYIGLEHVPQRSLVLSGYGYASDATSTKSKFQQGDILFGKLRPYFHKIIPAPFSGVCSTDIIVIRASEGCQSFALMHFTSDAVVEWVTQASTGTRMPRTKWQDLAEYGIPLPPVSLIEAFEQATATFIEAALITAQESQTLAAIRDTLLPKLMSGEIRVVEGAA